MDNQLLQIQNRTCHIYGTASAEYLLLHDMAQYRELEAFSKFSSDMDAVTAMTLDQIGRAHV